MSEDPVIRLVNVEFLRPGPPNNQLLSPLTPYLAVCGETGAGVVHVPYEHGRFDRLLKQLRYETGDPEDRLAMLHDLGTEMGKLLGGVPGLPGALTSGSSQTGALIHLRLTLSASELALLPFELAKTPVTDSVTGENWLSLHTRPPVCLTRHIRTVSPESVIWPERPRILFIAGDPENVPHKEHRQVLVEAIQRFRYPEDGDQKIADEERTRFGDLLTILIYPSLDEVMAECRKNRYTHIHVLAHGDLMDSSPGSYGIVLRGPEGAPDVVSGDRFRTAITSVHHRPAVVTLASCDSANVGTVVIPGASFAHQLHEAGIPLVVASQFPLSVDGSVPLTERLYNGFLWGEHPLLLLQEARAELHARFTASWHDWASLVVYEALPRDFSDQLDALRYRQTKRAMDAALEKIDKAVEAKDGTSDPSELERDVEYAVGRFNLDGQYGVECRGLRASSLKRIAQARFKLGGKSSAKDPYEPLDEARLEYLNAARGLLVSNSRTLQRIATVHWVLVQVASLSMVLGLDSDDGVWKAAKLSADLYCEHHDPEQRAWAHASLAELWLVRLADPGLTGEERRRIHEEAVREAKALGDFYPGQDEFPVKSSRRQFERYLTWWGDPELVKRVEEHQPGRRQPWGAPYSVKETAERLVAILRRKKPAGEEGAAETKGSAGGSAASGNGGATSGSTSGSEPAPTGGKRGRSLSKPSAAPRAAKRRTAPFFDIEALPAGHGDSLWIEYGDEATTHRWLIDCGTQQTYRPLLQRVDALSQGERFLELFVMSHIDSDHIGGALPFFRAVERGLRFGDVWFNGWRHISGRLGARQGEMFSTAIQDFGLPWNAWRDGGPIVVRDEEALPEHVLSGGMKLTLLSPTPDRLKKLGPVWQRELKRYGLEPGTRVDYRKFLKGTPSTSKDVDALADEPFGGDNGAPNGTSIALLAEFGGASALLAADAHAPVLVRSIDKLLKQRGLERLKVDVFKVSHHGSQNNVSTELVQRLDCSGYLVSTNGYHFCHPDRQAIARLIKYGGREGRRPKLYFNYKSQYNAVWSEPGLQERYEYTASYPPDDQPGTTVSLLAEGD
ncbi:MAG TPA: CHAT domain-containing protein [Thermoanaerobaculia bacterium]